MWVPFCLPLWNGDGLVPSFKKITRQIAANQLLFHKLSGAQNWGRSWRGTENYPQASFWAQNSWLAGESTLTPTNRSICPGEPHDKSKLSSYVLPLLWDQDENYTQAITSTWLMTQESRYMTPNHSSTAFLHTLTVVQVSRVLTSEFTIFCIEERWLSRQYSLTLVVTFSQGTKPIQSDCTGRGTGDSPPSFQCYS